MLGTPLSRLRDSPLRGVVISCPCLEDQGLASYGCDLRASEVVSLKVCDIDSAQMVIRIEQGKGRKDRYVMLSPDLLAMCGSGERRRDRRVGCFRDDQWLAH
jgi:integrase